MPNTIVTDIRYGPNPFSIKQGGLFYYEFTVVFEDGTPPDTFTYEIFAMTGDQQVLKHWMDTLATNGENHVDVRLAFQLLTDGSTPFPFGDFRNRFVVSAEGYPTWDQYFCSGGKVRPDKNCKCPATCGTGSMGRMG